MRYAAVLIWEATCLEFKDTGVANALPFELPELTAKINDLVNRRLEVLTSCDKLINPEEARKKHLPSLLQGFKESLRAWCRVYLRKEEAAIKPAVPILVSNSKDDGLPAISQITQPLSCSPHPPLPTQAQSFSARQDISERASSHHFSPATEGIRSIHSRGRPASGDMNLLPAAVRTSSPISKQIKPPATARRSGPFRGAFFPKQSHSSSRPTARQPQSLLLQQDFTQQDLAQEAAHQKSVIAAQHLQLLQRQTSVATSSTPENPKNLSAQEAEHIVTSSASRKEISAPPIARLDRRPSLSRSTEGGELESVAAVPILRTERRKRPTRAAGQQASNKLTAIYNNPFPSNSQLRPGVAVENENEPGRYALRSVTIQVERGREARSRDKHRITTRALRSRSTVELQEVTVDQATRADLLRRERMPVFGGRNLTMIESKVQDPNLSLRDQVSSQLRKRELGSNALYTKSCVSQQRIRANRLNDLRPWRSWKGASHDVMSLDWSPDSRYFAAGAVTHSNYEDLHYNRSCNLLLGDVDRNTIQELPDHFVKKKDLLRLRPPANGTAVSPGELDSNVFLTVTATQFSRLAGLNRLYTASEDHTLKSWDYQIGKLLHSKRYTSIINTMDVSTMKMGFLALGCRTTANAVSIYDDSNGELNFVKSFTSSRAEQRPEWRIFPECLRWGPHNSTSNLLLGGFSQWGIEGSERQGHLCLWDVAAEKTVEIRPSSNAIHSALWHPTRPMFAAGGSIGSSRLNLTYRDTETLVRVWDTRLERIVEYECPAKEIVDVTFHPCIDNIITAGCTDRTTYVWDARWHTRILHRLEHGKAILPRGERDTGVMMSLWCESDPSLFYSGSSDGRVLAWDVRRHPADVLIQEVANVGAGIQSGSFSPDGSHLLVGDATGSVHVLSSAPWAPRPDDDEEARASYKTTKMTLVRAAPSPSNTGDGDNPGTLGIETANTLLATGQIVHDDELGPGKGPRYTGPWALSEREGVKADLTNLSTVSSRTAGHLRKSIYKEQAVSTNGEIRKHSKAQRIRDVHKARRELLDDVLKSPAANQDVEGANHDLNDDSSNVEDESDDQWFPHLGATEIIKARANPRAVALYSDTDEMMNFIPEQTVIRSREARRKQKEEADRQALLQQSSTLTNRDRAGAGVIAYQSPWDETDMDTES